MLLLRAAPFQSKTYIIIEAVNVLLIHLRYILVIEGLKFPPGGTTRSGRWCL